MNVNRQQNSNFDEERERKRKIRSSEHVEAAANLA